MSLCICVIGSSASWNWMTMIVLKELMYLAIEKFAIALWLVQRKLATFSTNQMQNYIAHELVIRVFLHFRQFPCLGCHWLFQKFSVGLIGCCDYFGFCYRNSIEMHFIRIFWYYYLPEVKSQKSKRSKRCLANIGSKFLKKLWCCIGGGHHKIFWFYQLSW